MAYIRGHRLDFEGWKNAGLTGWGYDDVLPVFKAIEDNSRGASAYRGAGGPLRVADCTDPHPAHAAFLEAARSHGFRSDPAWEFSAPAHENGAGYYQKNIKDGRRHSAADAFVTPILSRSNLQIATGAQATRILIEGVRATGVEYLRNGQITRARARREIVLCAGVVDTPKLLMLSGIGPADRLRAAGVTVVADHPDVGQNLHDHLKLSIRWQGRTTLPGSTVTAGMFVRSQSGTAADSQPPDLQFYVGRGLDQPDRFVTITVSHVRPHSRGEIALRSADPMARPIIRPNYLADPRDVAALVAGVRLTRELARSTAYEKLRADETEPGAEHTSDAALADFARRAADTIYHAAGTCRMGTDARAVVDGGLRVRGIDGLRVADASVMPTVVSATTHAACVMIGARAAAFILQA
jgi:choline dehydrogenase